MLVRFVYNMLMFSLHPNLKLFVFKLENNLETGDLVEGIHYVVSAKNVPR